jgi:hypothetical protein
MANWKQMPGLMKQIAVYDRQEVWGIDNDGYLCKWNENNWQRIEWSVETLFPKGFKTKKSSQPVNYTWKFVSCGSSGEVLIISSGGEVWLYTERNKFEFVACYRKQVKAWNHLGITDDIFLLERSYQRDGDYIWHSPDINNTSVQTPGRLECISAGDGTIWAINTNNQIWRLEAANKDQKFEITRTWTLIAGSLKQISASIKGFLGKEHVWGITSDNQIWRWKDNSWELIPGVLKYISVGTDGTVWGLNPSNEVYALEGEPTDAVKVPEPISIRQRTISQNNLRDQVKVPISPTPEVTDEVLFEKASNTTQKLYLPRYRILEETVSAQQRYRISLIENGTLTLYLEAYPAPAIQQESRNAEMIDPEVSVLLTYRWQEQMEQAEFQVTKEPGGKILKAILRPEGNLNRGKLYQVFTNATYLAALTVRRKIDTAISGILPIISCGEERIAEEWDSVFNLETGFSKSRDGFAYSSSGIIYEGDLEFAWYHLFVDGVAKNKYIAICPRNDAKILKISSDSIDFGSITIAELESYDYESSDSLLVELDYRDTWNRGSTRSKGVEVNEDIEIYAVRTKKGYGKLKICSFSTKEEPRHPAIPWYTPPPPRKQVHVYWAAYHPFASIPIVYDIVTQVLTQTVDDTFFFPPLSYPYIFRELKPGATQSKDLIQKQVNWNGIWYRYYQDYQFRHRFYYLPERYEIGKRLSSQDPTMLVRFEFPDNDLDPDKMVVKTQYYAAPVISSERLKAAEAELMNREFIPLPSGSKGLEWVPLQVKNPQFHLQLPRSSNPESDTQRRDARVNLWEGIFDTLTLSFVDFQEVWDAMFSAQQEKTLFTGDVEIEIVEGATEQLPFFGRIQGDAEALLNSILEPNVPITYSKTLTVKTVSSVFNTQQPNPILSILVDLGQDTIELTPAKLEAQVKMSLPILDIILRREDAGIYPFDITLIRQDGNQERYSDKSENEIIYVPKRFPNAYSTVITVKTTESAFTSNTANSVIVILVDLGERTVALTQTQLEAKVQMNLPQKGAEIAFQIEVIFQNGKRDRYQNTTRSETINVP